MNLNPAMLKKVHVVNISNMTEEEVKARIGQYSNKTKDDEIYLFSTVNIITELENFPEGQVLTITINENQAPDLQDLLEGLAHLRDYYPDLTIKIADMGSVVDASMLPEDTIVKK